MSLADLNPFDLAGPEFLIFYFAAAGAVFLVYLFAVGRVEAGEAPELPLNDPYQIAYLRGGAFEAARVAVLSLVERGCLEIDVDRLLTRGAIPGLAPIERAIVDLCTVPTAARHVLGARSVAEACQDYQRRLEKLRLLPDGAMRRRRWQWFAVAVVALLGVGLIKIDIALGRGRTNLGFLVLLMLIAPWVIAQVARQHRTALGDAVLSDLRHLFRGGGMADAAGRFSSDALLLAAVFGIAAVPGAGFAEVKRLLASSASGSGSSCGGADGGGSGCGGGGGGGGCGGCGGSD